MIKIGLSKLGKPKNFFEVCSFTKNHGVGEKLFRKIWRFEEPSFWTVTKIETRDGVHGKAWGVLTWKGQSEETAKMIPGTHKRDWRYLPKEESSTNV